MDQKENTLVENSGMLTHLKTVACLKKNEWSVNISSYYYDNVADLVKEIDIIAEKQFNSAEFGWHSTAPLNVQLFIECKYINKEIVFWFDTVNKDKAMEKIEEETGLQVLDGDRVSADITANQFHYLQVEKVAKLFSTNSNNEDLVYKAISQCLRAQVYYEQFANAPIANEFNDRQETSTAIMRYPVVICDNYKNLKEVEVDTETSKFTVKDISDPFLLETNYVYFNKTKSATKDSHFLIDFINLDKFEPFLKVIEIEAAAIVRSMSLLRA